MAATTEVAVGEAAAPGAHPATRFRIITTPNHWVVKLIALISISEQLQRRIAELEERLADLERAAKRQATPFARKQRKENPKRPGRKAGQGRFTFRARPTPDQVTETHEQPSAACPTCGGPVRFAREVTGVLRAGLQLRDQKRALAPADFATQAAQLEAHLDALIDTRRQLTDPDNARFAKRLRKHRAHLFRFLYVDGLDATNNQAERMLRPAVVTRKTGGCNRTERGAETHAILASVLVTCRQQRFAILDALVKIQRNAGTTLHALAPPRLDTS